MYTLFWVEISGRSIHQQMFILQASDKLEYTWSHILSFPATSWSQSLGKSWNKVEYKPQQKFNTVSENSVCHSRVNTVLWMRLSYVSQTGLEMLVSRKKRSSCCRILDSSTAPLDLHAKCGWQGNQLHNPCNWFNDSSLGSLLVPMSMIWYL